MFTGFRRVLAVSALFLGWAAGAVSGAVAGGSECAPYVTTRINNEPDMGTLLGSETITQTFGVAPGGIGVSTSTTFNVGWYELSSGGLVRLDCRNYKVFA